MSLAINAAPFNQSDSGFSLNSNSNTSNSNSKANKSPDMSSKIKQFMASKNNNKTQKARQKESFKMDKETINSVLEKLHDATFDDEEDDTDNYLLPPPQSAGVEMTRHHENTKSNSHSSNSNSNSNIESFAAMDDQLELNDYSNYGDEKSNEEYYRRVVPGYKKAPHLGQNSNPSEHVENFQSSNDVLLKKMNYMIQLLEEQHDERTNNVTEEVVLYSFLGVFMIFIVDSFARVGKYVR